MDFGRLSESDLQDFLSRPYPVTVDPSLPLVEQAAQLFDQLRAFSNRQEVDFPTAVIDLYLASLYEGPRDIAYTPEQILSLSPDVVQAFDQIFQFDASQADLQTNRRRIFRILNYLGLIVQDILLEPPILEQFCRSLSATDLNNFRMIYHLDDLPCQVQVNDPDGRIQSFDRLNGFTFSIIQRIEQLGSNGYLLETVNRVQIPVIKLLLERGANPNAQDAEGWTPLAWASKTGPTELVKLLLEGGADPNLQLPYERSPLIWASVNNHPEIVRLLLQYQANPNFQEVNGKTALMLASSRGYLDIVQLLLEAGADRNLIDADGDTALNRATRWINHYRDSGPTYLASQQKYEEIVELLQSYQGQI